MYPSIALLCHPFLIYRKIVQLAYHVVLVYPSTKKTLSQVIGEALYAHNKWTKLIGPKELVACYKIYPNALAVEPHSE
jgi:hypothetical protein